MSPYRIAFLVLFPSVVLALGAAWFVQKPQPPSAGGAAATAGDSKPRAVVEADLHELGVMDPGERRTHKFVVRNAGTADLTLELASTSCKCTLADLNNVRVPPGGAHEIELQWHAERPQFRFRQGATIRTNDPALPRFDLVGEGSVRVKLATLPESPFLPEVSRTSPGTMTLLLYSQAFSELEVRSIRSSLPAIRAALSDNNPASEAVDEIRFQRDLIVTLEPQSKAGRYEATIRVEYVGRLPNGTEESGTYEFPVAFEVGGDFTLHGRDVAGKILVFGPVSQAVGATKQAYVHARGEKLDELRLAVKYCNPDFLQVSIGEPRRLAPLLTRFPITVQVPAGVPEQSLIDDSLGVIELETTFADRPSLRIPVSLIVVP